ncbi:hypothetical protein ACEXQE_06610 [Herbiconiux sp. P17]|uniref:hypothetical protein n=1 Tax=Herbiconiux wuyangfengii TaxID=3342794 RepID=UPI0035BB8597
MNYGKCVLIAGVAMIVLSAVLYLAIPTIGYAMLDTGAPSNEFVLGFIQLLMRFLGEALPPLGAALIGAGVVLIQVERRDAGSDT